MAQTETSKSTFTLSVRLPESVYLDVKKLAGEMHTSVNALMVDTLTKTVAEAHDREMYQAATLLGSDSNDTSVDFAHDAQAEVAVGNG